MFLKNLKMYGLVFLVFTIGMFCLFPQAFGQFSSLEKEDMMIITKSEKISDVEFDGKWTTVTEWKHSSLTQLQYDDSKKIMVKSAHSGDYIYVLIDFQNDYTLDNISDKSTICFDSKNNQSNIFDEDDYCFTVSLGQKQGNIFRGGGSFPLNSHLEQIKNENYISVSSKSDINNRFSKNIHPVYEFKIPIELLGRSDNYGFFISVYEATSNTYYNWPMEVNRENSKIPSPELWGNIISPDKSLPEFHIPLLIVISGLLAMIIFSRKFSFSKIYRI